MQIRKTLGFTDEATKMLSLSSSIHCFSKFLGISLCDDPKYVLIFPPYGFQTIPENVEDYAANFCSINLSTYTWVLAPKRICTNVSSLQLLFELKFDSS